MSDLQLFCKHCSAPFDLTNHDRWHCDKCGRKVSAFDLVTEANLGRDERDAEAARAKRHLDAGDDP